MTKFCIPGNIHCILAKVFRNCVWEMGLFFLYIVRTSLSFCFSHSFKKLLQSKSMKNVCLLYVLGVVFCTSSSN